MYRAATPTVQRLSKTPASLRSNPSSGAVYQQNDYNSYSIPVVNNEISFDEPPPSYEDASESSAYRQQQPPPLPNNYHPSPSPSPSFNNHRPPQPPEPPYRPHTDPGYSRPHPPVPPSRPPPPPPRPHGTPNSPNPPNPPSNNLPIVPYPAPRILAPNNPPRIFMNNPPMIANDVPIVMQNDKPLGGHRLLSLWLLSLFSFLILLFVVIGTSIPHWFRIQYDYRPDIKNANGGNNSGSGSSSGKDNDRNYDSGKDKDNAAAAAEEAERTILYSIGLFKTTMIGNNSLKCNDSDHCIQLYASRVFMILAIVASFIALIIALLVTFSSAYRKRKSYRIMIGVSLFATFVFSVVGLATGISFIEYAFNQPATDAQHDTELSLGAAPPLIIIATVTALGSAIYAFVAASYAYQEQIESR